jgi:hypothetical protein
MDANMGITKYLEKCVTMLNKDMDFTKLTTVYLMEHQKLLDFVYDDAATSEISRRINLAIIPTFYKDEEKHEI